MRQTQIDDLLKRTLDDFRVSRGEKKILADMVREHGESDQQLGFLRHRAFAVARDELVDPAGLSALDWLEDVLKAFQRREEAVQQQSEVYFSPGDDCPAVIQRLFEKTEQGVDVCVFTITDNRISDAIRDASQRGVKVRIISDDKKSMDLGSDIDRLKDLGISVRIDKSEHHMHHKYAVFDRQTTLTGSYNWTRSADKHNDENILVTAESGITRAYTGHFQRLWESLR